MKQQHSIYSMYSIAALPKIFLGNRSEDREVWKEEASKERLRSAGSQIKRALQKQNCLSLG